jgi:hypothetical protein
MTYPEELGILIAAARHTRTPIKKSLLASEARLVMKAQVAQDLDMHVTLKTIDSLVRRQWLAVVDHLYVLSPLGQNQLLIISDRLGRLSSVLQRVEGMAFRAR